MGAITYVLTDVLQLLKIVLLCNCIFMLQRKRKVSNVIVCFLSMLVVSFILYSCVSAVSYTHLDVYKRQGLTSAGTAGKKPEAFRFGKIIQPENSLPVFGGIN